jgi:hypothetical protein
MSVSKQFARPMIWSAVLSTSIALACKQPPDETPAEEKAPSKTVADPPVATEKPEAEVVIEEKIVPPVDEELADTLVREAREVAAAMNTAVDALDANDPNKAKTELDKAVVALTQIETKRPSIDVAVELWRKHQQLGVEELVSAVDTIPLLVTVNRIDVPVYNREQVQAHYEQRKGQAPETLSKQEKLSDLHLVDSQIAYFEVDLPIAASEIAVFEAQRLLEQGQSAEAKAALQRGIEAAEVVAVIVEAPEFQARQFIWDAENAFLRGDYAETKQLLAKANELLTPLAEREDDPQAKQMITTLLAEMQPLQETLQTAGGSEQANLFRRVARSALNISRRAALRHQLSRQHERERFALVDALMWLESAKTELALRPESHMVLRDLQTAEAALATASTAAPSSAKPNLEDLHARVLRLGELEQSDRKLFESELGHVIFDLRMLMFDLQALPVSTRHQDKRG